MCDLEKIKTLIHDIRNHKVMLDFDLAVLYGIEVKKLNQAVKRNINRFPSDFMFELSKTEQTEVVTNCDHLSNIKYRPTSVRVFTEEGVAMLSAILHSQQAVDVSISIMRAFVQLRHYVSGKNKQLEEIKELKQILMLHIDDTQNNLLNHDKALNEIYAVLNNLLEHPKPKRKIGFITEDDYKK